MVPTQTPPSICLSMQCSALAPASSEDLVYSKERFEVLRKQSNYYACGDYLKALSYQDCSIGEETLDATDRKKMIDWKYRVADHYGIDREIVAMSTSILDRFADCCLCDKKTFKLAAMASLHLATKVSVYSSLSMWKMAELSRGEFEVRDLEVMEGVLLKTLAFRVNPPTSQSFIQSLIRFVPVSNETILRAIYDRAIFFAEISLFDYGCALKSRSLIAVASLLNAIEGVTEGNISSEECEKEFLFRIYQVAGLDFSAIVMEETREELWYNYSTSTQYREDDMYHNMAPAVETSDDTYRKQYVGEMGHFYQISNSPVSVLNRKNSSS